MKHIFLILFSLGVMLSSCAEKRDAKSSLTPDLTESLLEVPNTIVDKSALIYDSKRSVWTLDGELYSGYAATYHPDGTLKQKMGILAGKRQNQTIECYADGHYKQLTNYHLGKLHGEKKRWAFESPHILIAHFNFYAGKAHGEQKKWYPTGELFQKINLNMGREDGVQQAFRKNGALFANYEAKEGRIFGLKRAALCFSLEDEEILDRK